MAALQSPETRRSLEEQGYGVIPSTPEEFAALRADTPRRGAVVRQAGAGID